MDEKTKSTISTMGTILLGALIALSLSLTAVQIYSLNFVGLDKNIPTIQVAGEGKVYVVPDVVEVSFSVVTENEDSEEALNENNKRTTSLVNYLKKEGVEEKNIQTTGFNVSPLHEWIEDDSSRGSRMETYSYQVRNSVYVVIEDVEKSSTIIDGAIRAGATETGSLNFTVKDEDEYKAQARELAIQEARERAEKTATSLGVRLGRVVSFSEQGDYAVPYMMRDSMMMSKEMDESGMGEVPIEVGEDEIIINVVIGYEIR